MKKLLIALMAITMSFGMLCAQKKDAKAQKKPAAEAAKKTPAGDVPNEMAYSPEGLSMKRFPAQGDYSFEGLFLALMDAQGKTVPEAKAVRDFLAISTNAKAEKRAAILTKEFSAWPGRIKDATGISIALTDNQIGLWVKEAIDSTGSGTYEDAFLFIKDFKKSPYFEKQNSVKLAEAQESMEGSYPANVEDTLHHFVPNDKKNIVRNMILKFRNGDKDKKLKPVEDLSSWGETSLETIFGTNENGETDAAAVAKAWGDAKMAITKSLVLEVIDQTEPNLPFPSAQYAAVEIKKLIVKKIDEELNKMTRDMVEKLGLYKKRVELVTAPTVAGK